MSVFLWGPPGVGKTTLASVVSRSTQRRFVELSAVTAGVKDVRAQIDNAKRELARGHPTVLFVDEVHRFSKAQQDVLLPAVENRLVTLIAATTENPSFSVIAPLLSRSLVVTLTPLTSEDIASLIDRALLDERGLAGKFTLDDDARQTIVALAGGDARRGLTYLEEAAAGAAAKGSGRIDAEALEQAVDRATLRYDKDGDQHYDVTSAFIKSVRGSDVDAALHYLARMIAAGEDPRFIARRLIILASEDIGMAQPSVLATCVAAGQAVELIGMPESRLPRQRQNRTRSMLPSTPHWLMCAAVAWARSRRTCAMPTTRRRPASVMGWAIAMRTTTRTASQHSSTCPTSWLGSITIGRPSTATRLVWGSGWKPWTPCCTRADQTGLSRVSPEALRCRSAPVPGSGRHVGPARLPWPTPCRLQ